MAFPGITRLSVKSLLSAVFLCTGVLSQTTFGDGLSHSGVTPAIDLGNIPSRPIPPPLPFKRFFEIQPLSALSFSPDNKTLYFIRNDGEYDNVFAIDLATFKMRQITHYRESVQSLLVGKSGLNLFLIQDQEGNEHYNIFRFDLNSKKTEQLTHSATHDMSYLCDQSSDGKLLYYGESRNTRSQSDLWRLNLETGKREIILASQGRLLECGSLSKDDRYLIFYEYIENNERPIGIVDLINHTQRYVFKMPHVNNINATFSGGKLYFMNAYRADNFYLWRYDPESGKCQPSSQHFPFPLQSFSLQDDGKVAVFRYRTNLTTKTVIFENTKNRPSSYHLPSGHIVDVIVSETDPQKAVFVTADVTHPEKYYLSNKSGKRLLYDANATGIAPALFSEARSFTISSFDGVNIPTHLFIPNGTSADRPRPVLVWIHGGPEEYIDPDFSSYFQFFNNRGYIIVTPNVRGSSGFGKHYAMLDDGEWGGGHVRDAIAVTEFIKTLPFVDSRNVFTFGESFGGYSVFSAITQFPDVYRGAIVFSGISELKSFLENLPRYADKYLLNQMGFDPRKDLQRNEIASPYYHIENIHIPLQIHQGSNDFRVKKQQTDQLVAKLRSRGLEVEYYLYNEGHGLLKFSDETLAYNRMLKFLNQHRGTKKLH